MKKAIYSSLSVLAFAIAVPAAAQTSGTVTGGAGIGIGAGGFTNGAIDTSAVSGTNSQTLSVDVTRNISASSGSGFGGTMNISSVPAGSSYAVVGGVGTSGSSIAANIDAANNGTITTTSFNAGLYGGLTGGSAALNMQVMNFGQSTADFKLVSSFDATHSDQFNLTSTDWTVAGAAGATAFGFGSLGWDVD
ncbi:hypothetical protein DC429_10020 [Arthrobacter sp. TPD3018]|jgi:hypothetical protein|uniref:hypothetical protein n=1 Tax=Bacteria TaxID=2 RepID=UPI000D518097|nr:MULTISPECIES: hypothetical protein [Bacteria]PVE57773.1 hypothetical protein DC425_07990 [Sphingomonas sp. TPD3009]PVE58623.1 hypothetical protein DC429_10020 [Arthrobacter sp. TPD3018]PVE86146.1 hypothetical protein DC431_10010 [Sphingomonas melonis]RTL20138.1 MAG: hypothetical protein EKK50_05220 [Sphingomonadaceae bacterium]